MRLLTSHAAAAERLNILLTDGYHLCARFEDERKMEREGGTWNEQAAMAAQDSVASDWLSKVHNALSEIFPTARESFEFRYPTLRGGGAVAEPDYEWKCRLLNLRRFIEALREIIDHRLSAYTDLPTQLRIYVEEIDSFAKVRDVNPAMVAASLSDGYFDRSEDRVQLALEQILNVSFHKKDWGGEINDLYTANVIVNGARRPTAFLLKGNGLKKKALEIRDCGKNGDQILRLTESPADLFVVQFVGGISEAVIKDIQGKVELLRSQGKQVNFCVIDGQDTARVMLAYGKL